MIPPVVPIRLQREKILFSGSDGRISPTAAQHWLKIAKNEGETLLLSTIYPLPDQEQCNFTPRGIYPHLLGKLSFPLCCDMLLQAHLFIVFLHPNAAMQRQGTDLNPFHETECQTAVLSGRGRRYFFFFFFRQQAVYQRRLSRFWSFDTQEAE